MPILHWLTRDADLRTAAQVPFRLLTEEPALSFAAPGSGGTGGMLVQGDNLEALKALLPFYAGRVKCIYIDPPYNTRSAFEHYDDNLQHAQWLGMIVPRLMLLREFLSEDGSIWVSIDDNEGHYLKVVMDEVFGRRNFVANVIWEKKFSPQNDALYLSDSHDHIMCFAKDISDWRPNKTILSDKQKANYSNEDNDPRGPWTPADYTCAKTNKERPNLYYSITNPNTREEIWPSPNRVWAYEAATTEKNIQRNLLWWGKTGRNTRPRIKKFLDADSANVVPKTVFSFSEVGSTQDSKREVRALGLGDDFATPKPERLIQRILHIASNPGDLVLDSFLGSGTTAAVAHKMGRCWIGVEMGDHARTHCATRLRKVIEGEQGGISKDVGWQGGGAFRFVTLGPRIYDENGVIAPEVRFADLARHVWFSETRRPLDGAPETPLLGIITPPPRVLAPEDAAGDEAGNGAEDEAPAPLPDRAVALLFNGILRDRTPQGGNVLTRATLALIRQHLPPGFTGMLTVYATACRLSPATLKREGVQFRQTPYDLNGGAA